MSYTDPRDAFVQCHYCNEYDLTEEATYTDLLGWFCRECWAELTEEEQEELI